MANKPDARINFNWVEGELRLAGVLDSRMIGLLKAIEQGGSINQAARQMNLSYKGAWQMIERANNLAPKALISTATGGSKGGGTKLTAAGQSLLQLFIRLDKQHSEFLQQLNRRLADEPGMQLLLKRLAIKTSSTNQLFGAVVAVKTSNINAEVIAKLKGGEQIVASLALTEFKSLAIGVGSDVLLLVNAIEIVVSTDPDRYRLSARNCLHGTIIRVQYDGIDSEVVIQLPGGESIVAVITQVSADSLGFIPGVSAYAVFKSNAVILGCAGQSEAV